MDPTEQHLMLSAGTLVVQNGNEKNNGSVCLKILLVAACITIVVLVTVLVLGCHYKNKEEQILSKDYKHHPVLDFTSCGLSSHDRISKGRQAALGQYPWMVLLMDSNGIAICGGTLISDRYVLTAAHCIKRVKTVRLGEHDINSDKDCEDIYEEHCAPHVQDFNVTANNAIQHPYFSVSKMVNDIALIRLPKPANLTEYVSPICLPYGKYADINDNQDRNLIMAGWGTIDGGNRTNILMYAKMNRVTERKCNQIFKEINQINTVDERNICAIGNGGQNHCSGDSGGPLHVLVDRDGSTITVLYGVVSFGEDTCSSPSSETVPGVFTKVSYYIDWIVNNMVE